MQGAMRGPNRKTVRKVRTLRRNSTDAEMKLWFGLRDRRLGGFKFVRQDSIGPYVADFVCRDRKVVVEVDGGQHAESARDQIRDAYLVSEGYRVLRFWNSDVSGNIEGVLETILSSLNSRAE
jgi:very-short-patch-repair endonuclease